MQIALGFIETDSFIGAVEASNVMVKTYNVILIGKEVFTTGSITVKIIGENSEVKAAVETGVQVIKKLGFNASSHIITDPDEQLLTILPEIKNVFSLLKKIPKEAAQKSKIVEPVKEEETPAEPLKTIDENKTVKEIRKKKEHKIPKEKPKEKVKEPVLQFKNDTITRLREEALGLNKVPKKSKEKKVKVEEKSNSDLKSLNVHQLRKIARSTKNFPIQGREISKANRNVLLKYFSELK